RLARIDVEGFAARGVLRAGGVEVPDRRSVVGAADPSVALAELELSEHWLLFEEVERPEELPGVDAVADVVHCRCHVLLLRSDVVWRPVLRTPPEGTARPVYRHRGRPPIFLLADTYLAARRSYRLAMELLERDE